MILDAITKKLEILLGGAVTANQLTFQCEWVDVTTTASTPGTNGGLTSGATPVDLVPVPGNSTQRIVNGINIYNADTVPQTVTVRFNDNTTLRTLKAVTLSVGDTLTWGLGDQWVVIDNAGNVHTTPASGNWLKTTVILTGTTAFVTQPNTHTIFARGVAGGGGGGGCSFAASNFAFGGGGAGGGYFEKTFAVSPLTSYVVAVGANGTAGANTGGTGGTGDTTIAVGGVTVTAKGGLGGVGMVTGATLIFALGGAHGTISTNGDVNGAGAPGNPGIRHSGLLGCSGAGGSSPFGGGGEGKNAHSVGIAGLGFGAGGGGGAAMTAAVLGGVGTAGVLVIDEFA